MEIQPFTKNQWHLGQTVLVEFAPWFKGKDVANSLEYVKTSQALQKHVDPEDRATYSDLMEGVEGSDGLANQQPHEIYINESGLYSLALRSNKPEAKAFKRWVTREVLPAIRQREHYDGGVAAADLLTPTRCLRAGTTDLGRDFQALATAVFAPIEQRLLESVRKEMQRTHPWEFHRHANRNSTLVELGVIVEGDLLAELDNDEHVVHVTDFLKERLTPQAWDMHGKKLKNLFAIELKKRKIAECEGGDKPLFIARAQGEYRPIYTEADTELMTDVFMRCKRRFHNVVTRDMALLKTHRKQRRIEDYFTATSDAANGVFRHESLGGDASAPSDAVMEHGAAEPTNSCATAAPLSLRHADSAIAVHRDALPEAPAELRLRAKRGDQDVCVRE